MNSINLTEKTCGKCDVMLKPDDKAVTCFTCKQDFHTQCGHVSDEKHAVLTNQTECANIAWFCQTCVRTTATMLRHVANLERRLTAIESERQKERHEVTVLQNLVKALNKKVNSLGEAIEESEEIIKVRLMQ